MTRMAMEVLPLNSGGGSFLDSPVFSNGRPHMVPKSGYDPRHTSITKLDFNNMPNSHLTQETEFNNNLSTSFITTPQSLDATPDSGVSELVCDSSIPSKCSDLDITGCLSITRSSSTGSGNGSTSGSSSRKRKTVTIDESQTSIVMISPDDLYQTYSKNHSPSSPTGYSQDNYHNHYHDNSHGYKKHDISMDGIKDDEEGDDDDEEGDYSWETDPMLPLGHQQENISRETYHVDSITGWPLTRSESLESRDNPFLPGGDLSKEAEDLLSKATIIRDNFYLAQEEKRELEQQAKAAQEQSQNPNQLKQLKQKHVQIVDHIDGRIYSSNESTPLQSPPQPQNGCVEERISVQTVSNTFVAPNHTRENGKSNDHTSPLNMTSSPSPEDVKIIIPEGEGQGDCLVPVDDRKRRNKCCTVM